MPGSALRRFFGCDIGSGNERPRSRRRKEPQYRAIRAPPSGAPDRRAASFRHTHPQRHLWHPGGGSRARGSPAPRHERIRQAPFRRAVGLPRAASCACEWPNWPIRPLATDVICLYPALHLQKRRIESTRLPMLGLRAGEDAMSQQARVTRTISLTALAALILPLLGWPAAAQFYVAKTGSDTNACTSHAAPCLTINGAIAKVPGGSLGTSIDVSAGIYSETVDIFYFRAVELRGDCSNLAAVEIRTTGVGIAVQDHAIGILRCLTITATVNGAAGIESRQYGIVDIDRIRFSGFPFGVHILVRESSRLACQPGPSGEPILVTGAAAIFAAARFGSHLTLNCPVALEGEDQSYTHFVECSVLSVCLASGLSWTGHSITGKQFNCDNSDLTQPSGVPPQGYVRSIPGSGFDNPDSRCRI